MEKRSLVRLFNKWALDFWRYKEEPVGGDLRSYMIECEEKRDIKPAMAGDRVL